VNKKRVAKNHKRHPKLTNYITTNTKLLNFINKKNKIKKKYAL